MRTRESLPVWPQEVPKPSHLMDPREADELLPMTPGPDADTNAGGPTSFRNQVAGLFDADSSRICRVLNRLSGDAEMAADLMQEAFLRLSRRGSMPENPEAWLISVAMNLLRNARTTHSRRLRLLTVARAEAVLADAPPAPDQTDSPVSIRARVRIALNSMSERDRALLLLHAEGYRYREIAEILGLGESSIGAFVARARQAFRRAWESADVSS